MPAPRHLAWICRCPFWLGKRLSRLVNPEDLFPLVSLYPDIVNRLLQMGVSRGQGDLDALLLRAVIYEEPGLVELLIVHGADPNAQGVIPATPCDVVMGKLFLDGPTPSIKRMLHALVRAGMDPSWRDSMGASPDQVASTAGHPYLFEEIQSEIDRARLQNSPQAPRATPIRRL